MTDDRESSERPAGSERRGGRRQRVDVPVVLHGGRLAVPARALDLSRQGMAVGVTDPTALVGADPHDPAAGVRGLQRAFVGGLVVQFRVAQEIRIPARLVRFGTGVSSDGTPVLGLRLARPLADDEWARLAIAPSAATPERLRPVRRDAPMELALVDAALGGPVRLAVIAVAPTTVVGAFLASAVAPAALRDRCGGAPRSARIDAGREILWIGSATLRQFHGGVVPPTARLDVVPRLPSAVFARLDPRTPGA